MSIYHPKSSNIFRLWWALVITATHLTLSADVSRHQQQLNKGSIAFILLENLVSQDLDRYRQIPGHKRRPVA